MIGATAEQSASVAEQLAGIVDYAGLQPEAAALCASLVRTVAEPNFPGALVPWIAPTGGLGVFVASATGADWRRLSPVLRAFAGPTLTSFAGLPSALPEDAPVAATILRAKPAVTSVVDLPADPRGQMAALRALDRARWTLARAPRLQRTAPEPTSWLLARFQDGLNVGRRDAAAAIVERLRSELRLDALNISFLQVQLLAAFEDWPGIVRLPGFANLCVARRTPAVTALLLEALYRVHVADAFEAGDQTAAEASFAHEVRSLALPMMTLPPPGILGAGGWRLLGLEALASPGRADLRAVVVAEGRDLGWIADRIAEPPAGPSRMPAAPLDEARRALATVEVVESVGSIAAVLEVLARLSPEDRRTLGEAEPFRSLLRTLDSEVTGTSLPGSWTEWLAKVAEPGFTNALEVARLGGDEWLIGAEGQDPTAVQAFLSALNAAQAAPLAAQRTAQALPFIVATLRRDPAFPSPGLVPAYASLLTLFALGAARGGSTYGSSQVLVHALLTSGLDARTYRALIADVEELAGDGFGTGMVYWLLDVVEEFLRVGAPDAGAREEFLHGALSRIAPIYLRLSSLQQESVKRLAGELGWGLDALGVSTGPAMADGIASRLHGLRVGIYSLTESSSRQAKAALEAVAPGVAVDCNADHGGTARLRAVAENCDVLVVAWLSAKHAATEFINKHRGGRPTIYAQGRGFTSIVRAVEEYVSQIGS